MSYIVSKEIKSETRVSKNIYAFDFLFIVMYMLVAFMLSEMVVDQLEIGFYIFSFIMAIFLTMPSAFNKKRRNYQTIILLLKRDTYVYRPIKETKKMRGKI